jgi:hypothetical protein
MFVPMILGSDKTTVSVGTGDNEFWPLYGSIGNIHNNMRRAHGAGLVLIAFLAIAKGVILFCPLIQRNQCFLVQLIMSIHWILLSVRFVGSCSIHR